MNHGDIRDEWRLNDIESKISRVEGRMHEVDSLRSTVDSLEHPNRDLSSTVDELRSELQAVQESNRRLIEYFSNIHDAQ